jgi:hypothetical protein
MKVGIIDFDQGDKNVKAVHDKSGGFALGCVLDGADDVPPRSWMMRLLGVDWEMVGRMVGWQSGWSGGNLGG